MIEIIFQNEFFVICDKKSGVLSTPSRFEERDERYCLGTDLQKFLNQQIYPVHRLDYEVSGLVMYAKTQDAHRAANSWFENKKIKKVYRALTAAQDFSHIPAQVQNSREKIELQPDQKMEWKSRIFRGKKRSFESPQGKDSLTLAEYLGANPGGFLMWDLYPVTGRSHQLRFELSRHGFPIIGDRLYGSKVPWRENSIALRSYKIDFSGVPQRVQLALPNDITVAAEKV